MIGQGAPQPSGGAAALHSLILLLAASIANAGEMTEFPHFLP